MRFLYDKYGKKKFGDTVQEELDMEVQKILKNQLSIARLLLEDKKEIVEIMVEKLLEKKTLTFGDIYDILGDRPFTPPLNFQR